MTKNGCQECPNPRGVSKTNYNGSKKAFFETKIQTKKQNSPIAVEQKGLYFQGLYQKI